ncbi:MucB/RseB C-terminal domain-containing protein [Planctobacterium marinum]|uniref:MucB/RseB C-terminal domain-containing protein n=1 Tax=Planctobacterium marinum TaxID=1631968 RepID=UPI001E591FEC|nr:MucB/RseB C-terminal domain-containing protein [Planctobacterium marinum]MCC2604754.1 MucB/RseB C-terminal domain-containing protein [Planctobacterium marinum]
MLIRILLVMSLLLNLPAMALQGKVIDGVSYPANSAEVWLQKFRDALHNLNFTLSFVVTRGNAETRPYIWRHGIVDGISMEHLSQLNGPGSEIFRIGDKVSFFEPNSVAFSLQSSHINGPVPLTFFESPIKLAEAYSFVVVGRTRVSGRAAQQIRIVSEDGSRYNTTLWLDQETGLLLKMDVNNAQGDLLEQLQVTSLDVTEAPDEYFEKIEQSRLPEISNLPNNPDLQFSWQLNFIPKGMEIIQKDRRRLVSSRDVVEYLMLSDGLVDVSVYISKDDGTVKEGGWLFHGSDTLLSISNGNIMVTVIGKIPPETANMIASSVGPVRSS